MSVIEKRVCVYHGETDFVRRKDGHFVCKKCAVEKVTERRRKVKEALVEYKGGKCEICGYDKCIDALEFHHLNPIEKEFGIGQDGYARSLEKSKKEADKCILVCANCHRELHFKEKEERAKKFEIVRKNTRKIDLDKEVVLSLIKDGYKQSDIARQLNISVSTLKRFLTSNGINMKNKKV